MARLLFLTIACILCFGFSPEPIEEHQKVEAQPGDGVFSLLRRYQLVEHACNIDQFYAINKLKREQHLIAGRSYKLPVKVYKYNGKSIRSTIGINDWNLAEAIADFNKALYEKEIFDAPYAESKMLWVPHHLINCGNARATTVSSTALHVPLFGKGYEMVKVRSERLKGKIFYIVSGHGGPDPGAMASVNGHDLCEDEYAYDVCLRLARNLMENGATVHVIIQDPNDGIRDGEVLDCDKEELCIGKYAIPLTQVKRLRQRNEIINAMYARYRKQGLNDQTVVCIHVDSRSPQKRQDVFFYHYDQSKAGKKLAQKIQKTFKEKYQKHRPDGQYHGTVTARNLFMLRFTHPTAVYIELANIKNYSDRKRIMPNYNRQALANWIYEGLTR